MKELSLLVFACAALAMASCAKIENASELDGFAGTPVEVGEDAGDSGVRIAILNEGAYPGASTLDVLDFGRKTLYADVFTQANPDVTGGLGNTGNDLEIAGGYLWAAMNASDMLVAVSPRDYTLRVVAELASPRSLASDDNYLYVTSYGAAVYGSETPINGNLCRFNLEEYIPETIQVGYQPEGLGILDGKVYVANSGGYNYVHDNRVSVVDTESFKVEKEIELPVSNLNMLRIAAGKIWVSTYGESTWSQDADGNWIQQMSAPMSLVALSPDGTSKVIEGVHADKITACDNVIYAIGNNSEMSGGYDLCLYKVDAASEAVETVHFSGTDLARVGYPYCIMVSPFTQDIYIADAAYFTGDSTLYCFTSDFKYKWSVTTGVGTGHLLLYQI